MARPEPIREGVQARELSGTDLAIDDHFQCREVRSFLRSSLNLPDGLPHLRIFGTVRHAKALWIVQKACFDPSRPLSLRVGSGSAAEFEFVAACRARRAQRHAAGVARADLRQPSTRFCAVFDALDAPFVRRNGGRYPGIHAPTRRAGHIPALTHVATKFGGLQPNANEPRSSSRISPGRRYSRDGLRVASAKADLGPQSRCG